MSEAATIDACAALAAGLTSAVLEGDVPNDQFTTAAEATAILDALASPAVERHTLVVLRSAAGYEGADKDSAALVRSAAPGLKDRLLTYRNRQFAVPIHSTRETTYRASLMPVAQFPSSEETKPAMEKITVRNFDDGVTLIAINRPDRRNAICAQTAIELQQVFAAFDRSDQQRVAVLTGTGDESFSAGADVTNLPELWRCVPTVGIVTDKPIISAVGGWCVGGTGHRNDVRPDDCR
ncbi:MAG: enoyl-CoA hydratase/isomerase family protein [Burkholderiaceae bacterium]|nr:enoyl-CoA hydratase/isomerase family protein [Burkholderiaceae bacterium]